MTIWEFISSSGFSALAGVVVAASLTFLFTEVRERRAFHQSLRKLAIEAALDNWRAEAARRRESTRDNVLGWELQGSPCPEEFLAEMFTLMDLATDQRKSFREIADQLTNLRK